MFYTGAKPMILDKKIAQSDFADAVGITKGAVSHLVRRGILAKGSTGGEWLQAYCGHLREIAAGRTSENTKLDLVEERAKLAQEQRRKLELHNAESMRKLIPADEMLATVSTAYMRQAQHLLSIADNLERKCGLSPAQAEQVETEIHGSMEQLRKALDELTKVDIQQLVDELRGLHPLFNDNGVK